jgi:hypothetical protein
MVVTPVDLIQSRIVNWCSSSAVVRRPTEAQGSSTIGSLPLPQLYHHRHLLHHLHHHAVAMSTLPVSSTLSVCLSIYLSVYCRHKYSLGNKGQLYQLQELLLFDRPVDVLL